MPLERALRRLSMLVRRLFRRNARVVVDAVGDSRIAWSPDHPIFLREYYLYCVGLLRQGLRDCPVALNVVLGDYAVDFGNAQRTLRADLQWEHTLVRPGGRDSAGALPGRMQAHDGKECYLVRIQDYARLRDLDLVIEYSRPNLVNVASCGRYDDFARRTVYVAPCLYPPEFEADARAGVVTLMSDRGQPRRLAFLDEARVAGLPLRNVKGVFSSDGLRRVYRRAQVLMNVHQTDDHHSFEELRVLPALLCGAVVVSEDVPLRTEIPYHEFVVWARREDLVERTRRVLADYAGVRRRIFGDGRLAATVHDLQQANAANTDAALRRCAGA